MSPKIAIIILILVTLSGGLFVYYLSVVGHDVPNGLDFSDFRTESTFPASDSVSEFRIILI